jgi:hypothetical protein
MERNPDITIGSLKIWVFGKVEHDFIQMNASYTSSAGTVAVSDYLDMYSFREFLEQCKYVRDTDNGKIVLAPLEPCLRVELQTDTLGHLKGEVILRPDPVYEMHTYLVEDLDLSYLPTIIRDCEKILSRNA